MKKYLLSVFFVFFTFCYSWAQNVTITPSGITPAMSGTYPRLSYPDILALSSPQMGDMAYDTTFLCLRVYNGSKWVCTHQYPNEPNMSAIASAGGTNYDYALSVAVDGSGNVYVTGYFIGTATFGATSKTSAGYEDIFVAKYSSAGTLQWVQTAGGTNYDYAHSVAVDGSGNVYVTGYFRGTATFGTTSKTSVGGSDIFVAKYSSAGTLQWVQTAGGTSNDLARSVAVDGSGNVYVTGYIVGTATFGAISKTSAGNEDIFVAKYDPVGTSWTWVQTAGGTSTDRAQSVAVDGSGNVYVTGFFRGTATFGATSKTSAGSEDIFVAKYSSAGTLLWVQTAGGTSNDLALSVAVDGSGNVYVTGYFVGTATFGAISKTSAGYEDIFVAKYSSGGTLQWVQTAGGASIDSALSVAIDGSDNVYVTGYFAGTATFGATSKTSAGGYDIFLVRIQQ